MKMLKLGLSLQKLVQKFSLFSLIFLLSSCSDVDESKLIHAKEPKAGVVYDSAVRYVNSMRYEAGLNSLNTNPNLEISSANHAKYLAQNDIISHNEQPNLSGFTGANPSERGFFAGYNSQISENVSSGQKDEIASTNDLMSAIYHRFGFLDMSIDEIGFLSQLGASGRYFVFNMGNSRLNEFCSHLKSDEGYGKFLTGLCKNRSLAIGAEHYEKLLKFSNANYVQFPIGDNVQTYFNEEIPDPLPECKITSNPVSIEFARNYGDIKFKDFAIFKDNKRLDDTILFNKRNDPNLILNERQFALFSRKVFDYDSEYRAKFDYEKEGEAHTIEWKFRTQTPYRPYFVVRDGKILGANSNQSQAQISDSFLMMESGREYEIYFYPRNCNDVLEKYSVSYNFTKKPEIKMIGANFIRIKIDGLKGQIVKFKPQNGEEIKIYLTSTKNYTLFTAQNLAILGGILLLFCFFIYKFRRQ